MWGDTVIEAVAIPDGDFVGAAHGQNNARDLIGKVELLTDECEDQVLPDLVCVTFRELESKRRALFMLRHFPNRLYSFDEQINGRTFGHLAGTL